VAALLALFKDLLRRGDGCDGSPFQTHVGRLHSALAAVDPRTYRAGAPFSRGWLTWPAWHCVRPLLRPIVRPDPGPLFLHCPSLQVLGAAGAYCAR